MSTGRRLVLLVLAWTGTITALHLWLNIDWSVVMNDRLPEDKRRLNVACIPVT